MPRRSRLTNTAATRGRSSGTPVSFSTIEARISSSSGVSHRQVRRPPRPGRRQDLLPARAAIRVEQRLPRRRRAGSRSPPAPATPSGGTSAISPVSSVPRLQQLDHLPAGPALRHDDLPQPRCRPRFSSAQDLLHRGPGRDLVLAELAARPRGRCSAPRSGTASRCRSPPPRPACRRRCAGPRRARPRSRAARSSGPRARYCALRPGDQTPNTTTSPTISSVSAFEATWRIIGADHVHAGAGPARRWCRRSRTSSTAPRRSRRFTACVRREVDRRLTDGFSRLSVGGATWSRIASTQKIASTAPAAPSRCPIDDLVEDIVTLPAASPSSRATAPSSISSPIGVEVPCALT